MATLPDQATVAVAQRSTATLWNDDVRDAINFLLNPPAAHIYNSANISCTTATQTLMTFNSESYDTDTDSPMHDTSSNNSRLYLNTTGLWTICAGLTFASNSTGRRSLRVEMNAGGTSGGGTLNREVINAAATSDTTMVTVTFDRRYTAGDYIEMYALQASGGNLNANGGVGYTYLTARFVGV